MTLLVDALTWPDLDGEPITIGGGDADLYFGEGVDGLGQPPTRPSFTDRAVGGQHRGLSLPSSATITTDVWLSIPEAEGVKDFAQLERLYASMNAIELPDDDKPLSWSGLGWSTEMRLWVAPLRCEWATDEDMVHGGLPGLDVQWVAVDPTKYSETPVVHGGDVDPASVHTFTVTNSGTRAHRMSGRAWLASIEAITDARNIYVSNVTTGQSAMLRGYTLPAGDTLSIDRWRSCRNGDLYLDGFPVTGSTIFPDWPVLARGDNEFEIGCESGTIVPTLTTRSTW